MASSRFTAEAVRSPTTTLQNSTTVAGWTLVSRISGLLRVLVIGAVLGPTYFANIFQTGSVVPNLVCTVVAGPVLAMVLVPSVVRVTVNGDTRRAAELLGRVSGLLLSLSVAVAVLLVLVSPIVAWTLTFAIPDEEARARAQQLTIVLILLVAPQVVLYTVAALGVAAQQSRQRFALAAGAPVVENVGLIGTVVLAGVVFGTGTEVGDASLQLVIMLGAGSTLAVAAHAGLQVFGAARVSLLARPSLGWREDPESVEVVRRLLRSVGVAAFPAAALYTVLALAATVPGGVLVLQVVYVVYYTVTALGARAISTAVLARLADAVHRVDSEAFASSWRQGLSYTAIVSLPVLCLLGVFAEPVAQLFANGELRSDDLIGQLAGCLAVVAMVQMVGGVRDIGRQALFARLDDRGPQLASALAYAVTLLTGTGMLLIPADGPRLVGLTLAVLAGETVAAAIVLVRLRSALRPGVLADRRQLCAALLGVVAMLPVVIPGWWLVRSVGAGRLADLALVAAFGTTSLIAYAFVVRVATTQRTEGAA